MGLPIPQALVEKLFRDFIKQLNPKELFEMLRHVVEEKLKDLKGDADDNGVIDGAQIMENLGCMAKDAEEISRLLALIEAHKAGKH